MHEISDKGLALIKKFEGLLLTAYQDVVGVWTIGYGTTNADKEFTGVTITGGTKISKSTAEKWLKKSIDGKYAPKVDKYDSKYHWTQNEFDALVSFAYNVGSIDQLTANGTRNRETIAGKMLEYNKAGGKVLSGLTDRRNQERKLFLNDNGIKEIYDMTKLQKGCDGQQVAALQYILRDTYNISVDPDGRFGTKTETALKKFPKIVGLADDGIAGPKTWAKLLDV